MCVFICVFEHLPLSYPRSYKKQFGDTFVFILTSWEKTADIFTNREKSPPAAFHSGTRITFLFSWPGTQAHENILSVLLFWDSLEISYRCSYCRSPDFYCTMAEQQLHFGSISKRGVYWKLLDIVRCVAGMLKCTCSVNHI